MIILIGGTTHAGKTYLAQQLLERYHMPYVSMDHLKMGIYRSNAACRFTPLDETDVIIRHIWPMTREMIKTNIENNQHLIVEGCYMYPEHIQAFSKQYREGIIPIFIVFSEAYIRNHFISHIIPYRNAMEQRAAFVEADYDIEEYIKEHEVYKQKCIKADMPFIEIKADYEAEIKEVFDYLDTRIRS